MRRSFLGRVPLEQLWQDLRYGARALCRSPGFSLTAILVLALAIGANTAVFSVIEGVLLRRLPYRNPGRLCVLWKSIPARNIEWDWTSAPTIRDWREQGEVFQDIAIVLRPEASKVTLQAGSEVDRLQASVVSGNFFDLLGVAPLRGRAFSPADERRKEDVAVLSYGFWLRRFGAGDSALGQTLRLDGRNVRIIGVMPASFQFPDKDAELWLLLSADPRWPLFQLPKFRIADAFCALARLKPGRSPGEANAQLAAVSARLAREYPATDTGLQVRVVPLSRQIAGDPIRRALWILGGAVFCVLLIACSNIASLLVARGLERRKELSIRAALGAGQGRLLRQFAAENILLSLAGGVGGVLLAYVALHSLLALAPPDLPRASGIAINRAVLGFSLGLCLLAALAFGLLPASFIARIEAPSGLRDRGRTTSSGPGMQRFRGLLVAAQYALAIVLLSGAGLLVRSFLLLNALDRGFDTARLLTVSVPLPSDKYREPARGQAFFDEALRRVQSLPGVAGAATGWAILGGFRGNAPNQNIVVEGRLLSPDPLLHGRNIVSPGYFHLLGIPLQEGRLFSAEDTAGKPLVAVINRSMARRLWPAESAIGKRFKQVLPGTDAAWITVVGVVGDVIYNRDGIVLPVFYSPERQWYFPERQLIVRTAADPRGLFSPISRELHLIDPGLPRFEVESVEGQLTEQDRPRRFQTELIAIFAGLALLLAVTGLYGLMAYAVQQRTKEIGIRVALGSTGAGIVRLVLRQALAWGGAGIAAGLVGAVLFGRALAASLYHVTPADPLTFAAVITLLTLAMLSASAFPALRAGKVDPTVALRHE